MSRVTIQQAVEIGIGHHTAGRLQQAETVYRQILAQHPNQPDAMHLLGVIAHQCGHHQTAVDLIQKSLAINPANAPAHANLGEAFRAMGRLNEAIAAHLQAMELDPRSAEALGNLGVAYFDSGQIEKAIEMYRRAISINARLPQFHSNLGSAFLKLGRPFEALQFLDEAIRIDPKFADAHNNRGSALEAIDRLEEAMSAYQRALDLKPNFATAANNVGNVARRLARWDEAERWCRRALQIDPKHGPAIWNVGLIELTRGDYKSGWPKHELRFTATPQRLPADLTAPRWDGRDLLGRTILIYAEQGLGDGFQAARYVPMVAARGGRVVIECHQSQVGMMRTVDGAERVIAREEARPPHDVFVPMMSLPLLLGTTLNSIPSNVPYFKVDAGRVAAWRERISQYAGLKVGLVWRGSATPEPLRSCKLSDLAPLGHCGNVRFFGLQVGDGAEEAKSITDKMQVIDLSADVVDFAETAACMLNLDLVITVDTAAAHLAGALAVRTWTLLPFSPDWRWLLDRQDSPWYPTMRLFRQSKRKEWADVIERVAEELRVLAERQSD